LEPAKPRKVACSVTPISTVVKALPTQTGDAF
jgi:hypothetical protein